MVRLLLALSLGLVGGTALNAQAVSSSSAPAPAIDGSTQSQDVHFRDARGDRMTVAVRLDGTGPYQFLVDTGADRSAVSSAIASRLALVPGNMAQLHTSTGVTTISTARVPSMEFAEPAQKQIEAAVLDSANMGADGIVGADVLRSQRVEFDFDRKTMTIVPSSTRTPRDEPGSIVVEARRKNGRLILTDAVANGRRITVVLDTGSEICVGNEALRRELLGRNLVDARQTVELESVTGARIAGDYMYVRELQMGGMSLANLAVVFTDAHTFKQLQLDNTPALLLGMNAFRAFKKVSIDFANRKFKAVVPEHSEIEARVAMRGQP